MGNIISNWANGLSGWEPSDPWEQGWQKYLYEVVNTNANLHTWGSSGKITLLPVPAVAGASGPYMYLKDCGEFDTQKYDYDHNFLHYAFGLPVGTKGAAANNFIDDILINRVGIDITGQGQGAQCGSATGNHNGLHVYNDYDWNIVSKEVSTENGGSVSFGWSFAGGDAKHGNDAAFWILKDVATGEVVDAGLLAQGPSPASGIATVALPYAQNGAHYILSIGQMNVGKYNGDQGAGNPHMLIGPVVQEEAPEPPAISVAPVVPALPVHEVIADWNGSTAGWQASDPWEQCWQKFLYEFVDTNVNLHTWGSCGKITLPPVPHVEGDSGHYLYMKDCGEFDTQKYDYDTNFLNYAFGLPVGTKGVAADNFIDNILINMVGIDVTGQGKGAQSGSAVGNYNGLHAYNDYDWNLVSKEIDAPNGGLVQFGWSFQGGDAKHGNDAAFWVLKDAVTGEIVAADLLSQGPAPASGIAEVSLPMTQGSGHYVLTIGQMNVGKYNCDQGAGNPHLLLGSVVLDRFEGISTMSIKSANFLSFTDVSADSHDSGGLVFGLADVNDVDAAGVSDLGIVGTDLELAGA
ncbi:MAG: hypothetical protein LBU45_02695 [Azoarcus sp.]|jgi:hypothetical protein|nr:hypothetical protein [Azoarcus sp.]